MISSISNIEELTCTNRGGGEGGTSQNKIK
jgi:hypothetical protein